MTRTKLTMLSCHRHPERFSQAIDEAAKYGSFSPQLTAVIRDFDGIKLHLQSLR